MEVNMKKIIVVLLVALVAIGSVAAQGDSEGGSVNLALNHVGATDHPYQAGAEKFAELVEVYSEGAITVDVFPASQIASGSKAIEFVQAGTLDIALESTMAFSNFVSEIGVLDLPFLFSSKQEAFKVIDGKIGDELERIAESKGFKVLGWWDNGYRSITSTRGPVATPADLAGLKIRTPESKVFLTTFETLGAIPTPMAVSEVFSALQLGTVDAAENSDSNNLKNKVIEVCPYYSVTKHIYTFEPLIMSTDKFESLSAEQQSAIMKAAAEAEVFQRETSVALDDKIMSAIRATDGVTVNVVEDLSEFQSASQPVYEAFPQFKSLLKVLDESR